LYYFAVATIATEAIVLHAFDYRETSRILRLATRDLGVCSVMARGVRRPRSRFSPALDLFAGGSAQIALHATGDMHTLSAFDVEKARSALALRWGRFAAASALSEMMIRFGSEDAQPTLYHALVGALDSLCVTEDARTVEAGLAGAWTIVAELGFAPALDQCASCGSQIRSDATARFAHRAGGVLCTPCTSSFPSAGR